MNGYIFRAGANILGGTLWVASGATLRVDGDLAVNGASSNIRTSGTVTANVMTAEQRLYTTTAFLNVIDGTVLLGDGAASIVRLNGMNWCRGNVANAFWGYRLTGWTTAEITNFAYTKFDLVTGAGLMTILDTSPSQTMNQVSGIRTNAAGWYYVGGSVNFRLKHGYLIMQPNSVAMATAPCTVAGTGTSGLIACGQKLIYCNSNEIIYPSYYMIEASQGLGNWNSTGSSGYIWDAAMFWVIPFSS